MDDSDAAHREPVEVTVYSKEGDQAITFVTLGESQEDGDPIWYAWAGIGELTPDQVYIRETKIGAIAVLGTEGAPTEGEINAPGITRDTVPGKTMPMKLHMTARRSRVRRSAPSPTAGWAMWT